MSRPRISVVIPTYNQAQRLRLVLVGLEAQTLDRKDFEVLVVDDGCTDGTAGMVGQAAANRLPGLRLVKAGGNRGRSAARNLGIAQAAGELVVFLDGDALPSPDLLEVYGACYDELGREAVLCGYQHCLPELEYIKDPETVELVTDVHMPSVLVDFLRARRDRIAVTAETIRRDFATVQGRARPGGYPFEESARRQDEVVELLAEDPRSPVGWLGFIPHNGAISTQRLRDAGGFDETIPFSEGWELAYRLQQGPNSMCAAVPAASYHLYHHHQFTDEEGARREARRRYRAIEYLAAVHEDPRVRLLYFWLAHLWPDPYIPESLVVGSLLDLDRQYSDLSEGDWLEHELVLRNHPTQFPLRPTEVKYGTCA